ncbi:hypothetical protein ABT013_20920 [Streptomyces bacillaris]|uniref:hypothetical protein n=1 Tax=Streptomyces bacillaris TaxID=68179 RepID=UPI0033468BF4
MRCPVLEAVVAVAELGLELELEPVSGRVLASAPEPPPAPGVGPEPGSGPRGVSLR